MLQPVLQNAIVATDAMKNLTPPHLHRVRILDEQRRKLLGSMVVAGCVSACSVFFCIARHMFPRALSYDLTWHLFTLALVRREIVDVTMIISR